MPAAAIRPLLPLPLQEARITANTETPPQNLLLRRGSLYAETAENLGLTVIRK